jgi:hypothetical protein
MRILIDENKQLKKERLDSFLNQIEFMITHSATPIHFLISSKNSILFGYNSIIETIAKSHAESGVTYEIVDIPSSIFNLTKLKSFIMDIGVQGILAKNKNSKLVRVAFDMGIPVLKIFS